MGAGSEWLHPSGAEKLCWTTGTEPRILNTYGTNPSPPHPKQNRTPPESRRYSFAKTDLYFKRFPVELKALVVRGKIPSRAANSVHEPRGPEPQLLLPRTFLKRKIPLEHSIEAIRVSVQPVRPRQPSPGDAFNLNNAQSRRNRVFCHTECGEVGGEEWRQPGETRAGVPSVLQFLSQISELPQGLPCSTSGAEGPAPCLLLCQGCPCWIQCGTELVPPPGCPARGNGSMENANWRFCLNLKVS